MKLIIIIPIAVIVIIGGILLFSSNKNESPKSTSNGGTQAKDTGQDKAPSFSLKDYNGNTVALSDFQGRNIIVNAWAVWCPFCVKELKDFAELERELGDSITIIAIDRAESLEKQKSYTDDLGVTDDMIFLLDPNDSFYRSIGGFSMPETLFVDGEGNILLHKRGPMTLEEMRQKVNQLFKL